jgi:hypothetical protein
MFRLTRPLTTAAQSDKPVSDVAMFSSSTFWQIVLGVLIAYLWLSVWLRHRAEVRAEEARWRALDREYPAKALDTAAIAPWIRRVRQDYAESANRHRRPVHYRVELLAAARRVVMSLAYFRRTKSEHEPQERDA